jgi:hypothetical protein
LLGLFFIAIYLSNALSRRSHTHVIFSLFSLCYISSLVRLDYVIDFYIQNKKKEKKETTITIIITKARRNVSSIFCFVSLQLEYKREETITYA